MELFSTARVDTQIGVYFLPGGIAVAQVQTGAKSPGLLLRPLVVDSNRIWSNYVNQSADRIDNLHTLAEGE